MKSRRRALKRNCRSAWNAQSWHSASRSKAEKPLATSPSVLGLGLPSIHSDMHGAQECMAASPLWGSLRSLLVHLKVYGLATVGNARTGLGAWSNLSPLLSQGPLTTRWLWCSSFPAKASESNSHQGLTECQFSIYWEFQDAKPGFRLNSPGYLGDAPRTQMGKSACILTQQHLLESIQGTQQRCQGYSKLTLEPFKCQQKVTYRIREHCWDQT